MKPAARRAARTGGRIRRRNRARILEAAEAGVRREGFDGATHRRDRGPAGLPKANLHYYFATKEALYRAVIDRHPAALARAFDAYRAATTTRPRRWAAISGARCGTASSIRPSRIFAAEVIRGAPVIHDFLAGELRAWVEEQGRVIRRLDRRRPDGPGRAGPSVLHDLGGDPDLCRFRRPDHGRAGSQADRSRSGIGDGAAGGPAAAWGAACGREKPAQAAGSTGDFGQPSQACCLSG